MKRLVIAALMLLAILPSALAQTREQRLKDHVYYFASDSLAGRKAGSADAAKAAAYIVEQYQALGLKPLFKDWYMPFMNNRYRNVVGWIEGSDPELKDQFIVLGAHYDHLGTENGKVYNGADDNASGSAALIEVARSLVADKDELKRSVIIAAFDAEEEGLYGSAALAEVLKSKDIRLMMSIDMVGWLKVNGKLILEGTGTIRNGNERLLKEASLCGINLDLVKFEKSIFTATDTDGFARQGRPTLAVSTGLKSPYHKPEDDADLIDYAGLDKVSAYITAVTEMAASDPDFYGSGKVAKKHEPRSLVEAGLTAGIGSSSLKFKDAGFSGGSKNAYSMGVYTTVGGNLAIQAAVLFHKTASELPDESNLYKASKEISRQSISVPVQLLLRTPDGLGAQGFIGAGAYYSRAINSRMSAVQWADNPNEWGLCYSAGASLGPVTIAFQHMAQMNRFFNAKADPKARMIQRQFTVYYSF